MTPEHYILNEKLPGTPVWLPLKKDIQIMVPNMHLYLFTAQMLQHFIDVVIKTSNNIFQLPRDAGTTYNIKTALKPVFLKIELGLSFIP